MNLTRDRLRSIGWVTLLSLCTALTGALTLRVNAVKSEVHKTETRIVSMRNQITFLETEFQTRSNQQQLKALNDVEFGYTAPRAQQYIEGERQLAVLGKPRGPDAPAPIRVATAVPDHPSGSFLPMVSPISGVAEARSVTQAQGNASAPASEPDSAGKATDDPVGAVIDAGNLGARLSRIEPIAAKKE